MLMTYRLNIEKMDMINSYPFLILLIIFSIMIKR